MSLPILLIGQNTYQIAVLKYNGGGDWYANPTALPNLIAFANENIGTNIKTERCNRILLSAIKQSLKFHLPKLNEAMPLKDFLELDFEGNKYIAHCEKSDKLELKNVKLEEKTLILIGPEGDFSPAEIEIALQNQFKAVSLGKSRLRTETAGLVAVHTININN